MQRVTRAELEACIAVNIIPHYKIYKFAWVFLIYAIEMKCDSLKKICEHQRPIRGA
jgi:hypothetical protein